MRTENCADCSVRNSIARFNSSEVMPYLREGTQRANGVYVHASSCGQKNPLRKIAGDFEFEVVRLEIETRIDYEAPHATVSASVQSTGQSCDTPESTDRIHGRARSAEIRMVQDIDRIDSELELF